MAFVREKGRASITGLQRHLNIGWARSAQLIEQMESQGIVSCQAMMANVRCCDYWEIHSVLQQAFTECLR
ncbi:DNA translocase FtsK [Mangrovibacter sp. SLW1]